MNATQWMIWHPRGNVPARLIEVRYGSPIALGYVVPVDAAALTELGCFIVTPSDLHATREDAVAVLAAELRARIASIQAELRDLEKSEMSDVQKACWDNVTEWAKEDCRKCDKEFLDKVDKIVHPWQCPSCKSTKTHSRSGVGFEDTRMCRNCGHVYEVGYIGL